MSDWIDVIEDSALADGEHTVIDVDGESIVIFKINGQCYAIEDKCTHDYGEIASGVLIGDEIVCPRHGARFCVKTGQAKSPPAYEDLVCFPIRIEQGRIQVKDERWE